MITLQNVQAEVARIREMRGDDEGAHSAEDKLHQLVLTAIANDECADPKACAAAALKTREIDFARWCA